uniref:Uncharacterized protein n=1 Tax=Zea mays TaxID=4577 RepID=C4J5N1_MAIZE|nr:unknown [Zea mays]ACR36933.1 unknown [Zea mays]
MSACSLRSVMAVRFLARYPRTRACSFTSDLRARSAFRAKYPLKAFWMTTAAAATRSWPQLHGRTCDSSPAATEGRRAPPSATLFLGLAKLHRLFSAGGKAAHAAFCALRSLSPWCLLPASTFLSHLIARPMAWFS